MSFASFLAAEPLERHLHRAENATPEEVERALRAARPDFADFLALLSPRAASRLETLARRAQSLTRERFGRVVQLYAPLYVSNECTNACLYCGFSRANPIRRITLTAEEVVSEARVLWEQGFRNLLLVSGEAPSVVPVEEWEQLARGLHGLFPSLSVEIYPLDESGYRRLVDAGVDGLTVYQETYDRTLYERVHPAGRKADYDWRLGAAERGAAAGMRRVGIGALLGLGPWRREAVALGLHALWMQREHWRTQVCLSFPRLRRAAGGFEPPQPVSDAELLQLACALRLLLPDAGLFLSTRESAGFRDGIAPICITHMSAGSRTEPGGYTRPDEAAGQFSVEDRRPATEVAAGLLRAGLEPVWKDWDAAFTPGKPDETPVDESRNPCA